MSEARHHLVLHKHHYVRIELAMEVMKTIPDKVYLILHGLGLVLEKLYRGLSKFEP